MNIITGIGQYTLAGTFAMWYFARRKPQDIPTGALLIGFKNCFWHFGTIAFGAFIISVVQLLRKILDFIDKKTKKSQNQVIKVRVLTILCLVS